MAAQRAGRRHASGLPVLLLALCSAAGQAPAESAPERGEYVLRAAGCVACHTDVDNEGELLAGGRALATPFGTFYSPNITSDSEHGIGSWTLEQFRAALRAGERPAGGHYYPVLPYPAYSAMRDEDVEALFAYLRTVPAVARANEEHDLAWHVSWRFTARVWNWLFFDPLPTPEGRGEYLVKALGHCDECHTPRTVFGAVDRSRHLVGNPSGPEGEAVPNITPDRETGIGAWGKSELVRYLRNGMLPDMDFVGGAMVEVIDEGLAHLSDEDRVAIAQYLRSLEPVHNPIE